MHGRCLRVFCACLVGCLLLPTPARSGEDCNGDGVPDDQHGLGLLFFDQFAWTTIDSSHWAANDSATVDDVGLNEPSGLYALRLNGSCFGGDTLESVAINLTAAGDVVLSYYWQRTGGGDSPEMGDDLVVEYRDADGVWTPLAQHPGDGADMTVFAPATIELPAQAYHADFAFRFRNVATRGQFDDWFVDNVYLIDLVPDCNGNGVPDDCDIDDGVSLDCNGNGIPDECDVTLGVSADCNENLIPDECDSVAGYSEDINGDFIPDECQDCNGNEVLDPIDILLETSADCDGDGVPDECSLAAGLDTDCDGGGAPDACDIAARLYSVDDGTFETKIGSAIGGGIIWLNQFVVEPGGEDAQAVEIAWGQASAGLLATLAVWADPDNDGDPSNAELLLQVASVHVQNPATNRYFTAEIPRTRLGEAGDVFYVGAYMHCEVLSYPAALDSSSSSKQRSWVAFGDNLADLENNPYPPALIDAYGSPGNFMLRCVSADRDCNGNGVFDVCDIAALDSYDNNLNGVPDECELGSAVSLELIPDAACYGVGDVVTVEIWMNGAEEIVVGGQFFLDYDAERLALIAAEPAQAPFVFTEQVYECSMHESGGGVCEPLEGTLDYAVGIDPAEGGAAGESMMAVLSFNALAPICDSEALLDWRLDGVVRLGADSNTALYPLLTPIVLGDFAPPALSVQPDMLLEIDQAGQCQATAVIADPAVSDDCTDQANLDVTWQRSDGELALDAPFDVADSPITIAWQAADECGNVATDATIVVIVMLGDLDYDSDVDLSDLAQLLANYGTTAGAAYEQGDLDHDGDVELSDLAALLSVYGTACP